MAKIKTNSGKSLKINDLKGESLTIKARNEGYDLISNRRNWKVSLIYIKDVCYFRIAKYLIHGK